MITKVVDGVMLVWVSGLWVVVVANALVWYAIYSPWLLLTQERRFP